MSPEQKEKIDALLTGFKELDLDRLDQALGNVYKKNGECGACVGAWSAVFLGLPKYEPQRYLENQGSRWRYEDGVEALEKLFGLSNSELEVFLTNCGAAYDPFGSDDWENPPYPVFRRAVKRKFDYDFEGSPTVLEA